MVGPLSIIIDSRVKIIDNERPGASPCDLRGRLHANNTKSIQGRIQDFKLGGGGALKQIAPSGGRLENVWGISCEKSRFYAKKSYFFQLRREARKLLGYFV